MAGSYIPAYVCPLCIGLGYSPPHFASVSDISTPHLAESEVRTASISILPGCQCLDRVAADICGTMSGLNPPCVVPPIKPPTGLVGMSLVVHIFEVQ